MNVNKSSYVMGRTALLMQIRLVKRYNQFYKKLRTTYLGVPLHKGRAKVDLFDEVIARMRGILHGWEMKVLSQGGLAYAN